MCRLMTNESIDSNNDKNNENVDSLLDNDDDSGDSEMIEEQLIAPTDVCVLN